jgi:death-on-curing protein
MTSSPQVRSRSARSSRYGISDCSTPPWHAPQATIFGVDAYPSTFEKAAALLQSLARNHALVDGNKRTAWAAAWTFLHINGFELSPDFDVDVAEALMNEFATTDGSLDGIATALAEFAVRTQP